MVAKKNCLFGLDCLSPRLGNGQRRPGLLREPRGLLISLVWNRIPLPRLGKGQRGSHILFGSRKSWWLCLDLNTFYSFEGRDGDGYISWGAGRAERHSLRWALVLLFCLGNAIGTSFLILP